MKRKLTVISLMLCMLLLLSAVFAVALSANDGSGEPEMGSIEEILASYYDPNGRPMSCAHRAITYIGNPIPENSLLAIQDCIDHKVDIVELDIMRTKDGIYVICHDSSIKRTTTYNGSLNVSDMTYAEICQYPLLQYTGGSRDVYYDENGKFQTMPTFEQVLELCKGNAMINLDKFTGQWSRRMELYEIVKKHGCLDIVMFKGGYDSQTIKGWHDEIRVKYGSDAQMPNFCTLNSNRNATGWVNDIRAHYNAKTAFAVEAGFSDYTQPQSNPFYVSQVKNYVRAFANVLYESLGGTYSAKNKENSTGWAEVISLGYNILQTNNAADLAAYIYANYSTPTRDMGEGLDLLYFNDFKHDQTSYTLEIHAPSVKLYNGDYISFKNVDFGSCEGESLIANITGSSGKGELVVRKGSRTGDVIAKFDLSNIGNQTISLVDELRVDGLGVCDIYVCAENTADGYVSASKLICADPTAGEIVRIVGLSAFTRPGVAPDLPAEVSVVNEFGLTYKSEVVWSPIPEECYSENLTAFKVPGILRENCQTIYANVTVIDLDMSGAAVWFDSKGDMALGKSGEVLEWYDRINSISATANGSAPTYKNGVVSFDGDSMVYNHSLSKKSDVSIIINAKTDKNSTDYLSDYKINNSARYTLLQYPEADSWGSVYFTAFKNGIVCRFGSGESGNRGIYYTGKKVEGWSTVSAVKKGSSEKLYLGSSMIYDRSTNTSSDYQAGSPGSMIAATHEYAYIGFGIQGGVNYYYDGDVGDIVVFERTLGADEIATLNSYFTAKNQNTLTDKSDIVAAEFASFLENNSEKVHSLEYASADASNHAVTCKNCSYSATAAHSFEYSEKDEEKHTKTCSFCAYSYEEEHDYQPAVAEDGREIEKCADCNAEKEKSGSPLVAVLICVFAVVAVGAAAFGVIWYKKKAPNPKA